MPDLGRGGNGQSGCGKPEFKIQYGPLEREIGAPFLHGVVCFADPVKNAVFKNRFAAERNAAELSGKRFFDRTLPDE